MSMHGDGVSATFKSENGENFATVQNQDMGLFTVT
jgi:hypothetical protein